MLTSLEKATEEDKEKQDRTDSPTSAGNISKDAAVAAVLKEVDDIFILKVKQQTACSKLFLVNSVLLLYS